MVSRTEYHIRIQLILPMCAMENIKLVVYPMENERCYEQSCCISMNMDVRAFVWLFILNPERLTSVKYINW